jgi:hypothetical protein
LILGGEGSEVYEHVPELYDTEMKKSELIDTNELIVNKSLNFWCSTQI